MTYRSNIEGLADAIRAAHIPRDLGGLYSDMKSLLRDHGISDAGVLAHHFEAALIDARVEQRFGRKP